MPKCLYQTVTTFFSSKCILHFKWQPCFKLVGHCVYARFSSLFSARVTEIRPTGLSYPFIWKLCHCLDVRIGHVQRSSVLILLSIMNLGAQGRGSPRLAS